MLFSSTHQFYTRLFSSFFLSLSLITTPLALAEYTPPPQPSAPSCPDTEKIGCTRATGTRGGSCTSNSQTQLTILAPYSHVGQTVSTSPTVAWFIPESESFPLEFSLYEYEGDNKRRILFQELNSSPGIMKLSLPNLSVGKRYLWQVVLLCNPNRPSGALVARGEIDVVAAPSTLTSRLATINDPVAKGNLYAEFGLWYDAFGIALEIADNLKSQDLQLSLLENLSRLEGASNLEYVKEQSVRIQQIIEEKRQSN